MITVARTFNIMLNESGKSGHPCLITEFSGKPFSFFPLTKTLFQNDSPKNVTSEDLCFSLLLGTGITSYNSTIHLYTDS